MPLYKPSADEQAVLNKLDSSYYYTSTTGATECMLIDNYRKLPWVTGRGSDHESAMKDAIAKGRELGKPKSEAQRIIDAGADKDQRIKQLEAQIAAIEAKKSKKSKVKAATENDEPEDSDEPDEGGDVPPPAIPTAPKAPTGAKK